MDADAMVDLTRRAVLLVLLLGAPVLVTALVVSLIVSVLQAATQVQELTLTFVPKIIAVLLALVALAPWMFARLGEFASEMFDSRLW